MKTLLNVPSKRARSLLLVSMELYVLIAACTVYLTIEHQAHKTVIDAFMTAGMYDLLEADILQGIQPVLSTMQVFSQDRSPRGAGKPVTNNDGLPSLVFLTGRISVLQGATGAPCCEGALSKMIQLEASI